MLGHAIDPVRRDLIRNALCTIADNMIVTVIQTARSHIVKNKLDFSTAISDEQGRLVAQGLALPAHLGAMTPALQGVLARYRDDIKPGDVFINNDPYSGGSHLIDIFMFRPLFADSRLLGFAGIIIHHTDIGGRVAGGQASDNTEIYQEGLRMPPLKIIEQGARNETLFTVIEANVRVPHKVIGDLRAQLSALHIAAREVDKLVEKYGRETLELYMGDLIEYTERLTRTAIRSLPDGSAEFTDYIDDDGIGNDPICIKARVTKQGDEITVDFAGTSRQTRSSINPNIEFTRSCVYAAIRTLLDPDMPNNDGFHRPIHIVAEPGSFVNPVFPAAFAARGLASHRLRQCVFGALSKLLPERVPACYGGSECLVGIYGRDEQGQIFLCQEGQNTTSLGGGPDRDGQDGAAFVLSNVANSPIEVIEAENPVMIEEYAFIADSGGAGRFRGGLGVVRQWRILTDSVTVQLRADRHKKGPWGLFGGRSGRTTHLSVQPANGGEPWIPPPKGRIELRRNDVLRAEMAGAGGFGEPLERDPAKVVEDVRQEKLTLAHARSEYGVVIDRKGDRLELNEEATRRLRASLGGQAGAA